MPLRPPPPRSPWVIEHRVHEAGERDVDVRFRVTFEAQSKGDDPEALRMEALRVLKRVVSDLEQGTWQRHSTLTGGQVKKAGGPVEGPFHIPAAKRRPPRPRNAWTRPELPQKDLRTCHEILVGLLLLGVHGHAVPVGDLMKKRNIPHQRLYRVLDPESPGYQYLEPFIQDLKSKGKRLLDLTPEGRQVASRIRAGEIPAR